MRINDLHSVTGRRRARRALSAATLAVLLMGAQACASGDSSSSGTFAGKQLGDWENAASNRPAAATATDPKQKAKTSSFDVVGSVNQVTVTKAEPADKLRLESANGTEVATGAADAEGALIFREIPEGGDYRVINTTTDAASDPFPVMSVENSLPPEKFYSDQKLKEGFQYITTRDGTKLSATVYLPPGDGPYPTVVEYSGYDPANPTQDLVDTISKLVPDTETLCETIKIVCNKPAQPSSLIAASMGYAVVAVNMRGTGCSGGSYDYFEPLQLLDGYDVIETAAAQSWVRGNKVGMVGLSYPGISQLFVASTQPPNLAAIAPMSVFDDSARGVLAPGGLFNEGFALEWVREVLERAKPLGQGWEQEVIDGGDKVCAENQKLRGQNVDVVAKARSYEFYDAKVGDPLSPATFVNKINVPVFMTGAWQDEQTGPRFVNLWDKFTSSPNVKFTAFNGAHGDGYSPETLNEWKLFLDFFVAGERTPIPGFLRAFGPQLIGDSFKASLEFPPERLLDGNFADLKTQYEAEPPVRILWERGARPENIGAPESTGSTLFGSWPPAGRVATSWYLQPDGSLRDAKPTAADAASRWTEDPGLATKQTLPGDKGGQAFHVLPEWEWNQDTPGGAAVFVSRPVVTDTVLLGGGRAELWVRSTEPDANVALTVSEVRPDGKETYLQSGVQRARLAVPGPNANELDPDHRGTLDASRALVPGEWTKLSVDVWPVGHVLRKGSRLRLSIHSPGGDKPRWSWIVDANLRPTIDIGHDAQHPSRLVLPVQAGVSGYQAKLPTCPSLRGQPCRDFVPYRNTPAP